MTSEARCLLNPRGLPPQFSTRGVGREGAEGSSLCNSHPGDHTDASFVLTQGLRASTRNALQRGDHSPGVTRGQVAAGEASQSAHDRGDSTPVKAPTPRQSHPGLEGRLGLRLPILALEGKLGSSKGLI